MAVAFDAQSSASTTANSGTSHNHTNLTVGTGSNRALVVLLNFSGTAMANPTVTWDSGGTNQSCTLIANALNSSSNRNSFLYGLVAPTSGNKTLAVSWSGSRNVYCAAVSFTGVDQTGGTTSFPNGTNALSSSGTSATVTVTSATGDYVVATHVSGTAAFSSVNQTQIFINNTATTISAGGNRAVGAATVAMTGTLDVSGTSGSVGASIKASASTAYSLTAAAGSYAFTGTAATTRLGRNVSATAGSYAFTGSPATPTKLSNKTLVADAGSYGFTGSTATLVRTLKAVADSASYAFAGTDVTLTKAGGGGGLPAFRHLTSVAYASQPTGSMTVDKPTGTVEGDILLAVMASGSSSLTDVNTAMTPPSGFTVIGTPTVVAFSGFYVKQFVLWKRAGASEPSTYTFNHDAVGTMGGTVALAAYSNCIASGDPVDVFSQNSATTGATATGISVTTTVANTKLVNLSHNWDGTGTLSPPSGMTERFDGLVYVSDEDCPTAGATGDRTQTLAASTTPWQSYLVALKGASGGATAYSLTAAAGSYAFTGTDTATRLTRSLFVSPGSYDFTGTPVTLTKESGPASYTLSALAGSYLFTGFSAATRCGRVLTATAGAYSFTGTPVTLSKGAASTLIAGSGSYSFTGTPTGFRSGKSILAVAGLYSFVGTDVTHRFTRKIQALGGAYGFAGTTATLKHVRKIVASPGSYGFTGTTVTVGRGLLTEPGSYLFAGSPVNFSRTSRRLTAIPGSYAFTGTPATLIYRPTSTSTYALVAAPGSYSFTGTPVVVGRALITKPGSYRFTGSEVRLAKFRQLIATSGSYAFTGSEITLHATGVFGQQLQVSVGDVDVHFDVRFEAEGLELSVLMEPVSVGVPAIPFFRSISNTTYAVRSSLTTVDKPVSTTDGDIMIAAFFGVASVPENIIIDVPPSGWTLIGTPTLVTDTGSISGKLWVYWKRAASEPASYNFLHDNSLVTQAVISSYGASVLSGDPVDVFSQASESGVTSGIATAASVTTTIDKTRLINVGHNWDGAGTLTPPSGMTEHFDGIIYLSDEPRPTAGATGNRTQTLASTNPWQAYLIALEPGLSNDIRVRVEGQEVAVSAGVITHVQTVVDGFGLTVSVGDDIVIGIKYGWNNNTLVGSGVLSGYEMILTATTPSVQTSVISSMKWGPGEHYVETMFEGNNIAGLYGLYNQAADTGVMVELESGNIIERPSGTVTPMFQPIMDNDVIGIAYNGDVGRAWFKLNGGLWNEDAAQSPDSTGIGLWEPPAGVGCHGPLTPYTGSHRITVPGTLIEDKFIIDRIDVAADNVTIRNCEIYNEEFYGITADNNFGLVVDHCTLHGVINGGGAISTGSNFLIKACDIYQWDNGIFIGDDGIVEDCYIHDLGVPGAGAGEAHLDGIQFAGNNENVIIRNNWIATWDTSCVIIKADYGPIDNVLIEGNTLKNQQYPERITAFPIFAVSLGAEKLVTNVFIKNNRIERGSYGYVDATGSRPEASGNIDFFTGEPILDEYAGFVMGSNLMSIEVGVVDVPPVEPTGNAMSLRGNYVGVVGPPVSTPVLRSANNSGYNNVSDAYIDRPEDVQENDILIVTLLQVRAGETPQSPVPFSPGWEQIGEYSEVDESGTFAKFSVWWKRASAVEPAQYIWAYWHAAYTQWWIGAYSGCSKAGAIDTYSMNNHEFTTHDDIDAEGLSVTTTQENDKLLWLSHNWDGLGTIDPPDGMTELLDEILYIADETIPDQGPTGDRVTIFGGFAYSVFLVALRGE